MNAWFNTAVVWVRQPLCAVAMLFALALAAALAPAQTTQTTQPAAPYRPPLFAYGSSDRYWVANVESYRAGTKPMYKTLVRGQTLPAGDWKDLGVVFGHAAALADVQGELAVLLDDGAWKRVSDVGNTAGAVGITTGPTVPGSGQVLAWGSADGSLYAVRAVEGGRDAINPREPDAPTTATRPSTQSVATSQSTSAPATAASSAASKPATRPLTLVLMRYDRGQWTGVADLPSDLVNAARFSLASIGNKPLLAVGGLEVGITRTLTWNDAKWEDLGEVRTGGETASFGLVSAADAAALWTLASDGAMHLFIKREGEAWTPLKAFTLPGAPAGAQRALAAAGKEFRVVFLKDGKLWEQRYDLTGAQRGSLTEMPTPQSNRPDQLVRILQLLVVLGAVVAMLVTFYRRRVNGDKKDET